MNGGNKGRDTLSQVLGCYTALIFVSALPGVSLHLCCSESTSSRGTWPSKFRCWLLSRQPVRIETSSPQDPPTRFFQGARDQGTGAEGLTSGSPEAGYPQGGKRALERTPSRGPAQPGLSAFRAQRRPHLSARAPFWVAAFWRLPSPTSREAAAASSHLTAARGGANAGRELFYHRASQAKGFRLLIIPYDGWQTFYTKGGSFSLRQGATSPIQNSFSSPIIYYLLNLLSRGLYKLRI